VSNKSVLSHKVYVKQGFTLLELLLVVVILSVVAFTMMSTIEDNVSQVRYEDTRNRLNAIRTAVIGPSSLATWERGIQSGFVVDNGKLPVNIDALVDRPANYSTFGAVAPVFDQGGANEFDFTNAPNPEKYQLMKGHRGGYLPKSTDDKYRDGWGTKDNDIGEDNANHGWSVTTNANELFVESYGMDGQTGRLTSNPYEVDMSMSPMIVADDWQVDVSGRIVTVKNLSGFDVGSGSSAGLNMELKASLLVYENSETGGKWRQVTTAPITTAYPNGDLMSFALPSNTKIPVGEHLLVLVADEKVNLEDADGTPGNWGGPDYVTKRIKFFSRGGVPDMVMEIR
jgi:prepilin-type N-terminal cleavage/methylation domain-containing protein